MHANRKSDFGFRRNIGEHDDDTRRPPRDTAEQQSRTRSGFLKWHKHQLSDITLDTTIIYTCAIMSKIPTYNIH